MGLKGTSAKSSHWRPSPGTNGWIETHDVAGVLPKMKDYMEKDIGPVTTILDGRKRRREQGPDFLDNPFTIRRDDSDPQMKLTFKLIDFPFEGAMYSIGYWRSGWRDLHWDFPDTVKKRVTIAYVGDRDDPLAAMKFAEFRINQEITTADFLEAMDADDEHTSKLSCVLTAAWPEIVDAAMHGNILEFHRGWAKVGASKNLWSAASEFLMMDKLFKNSVVLILKAFPLEHESRPSEESDDPKLPKRQAAMMRYYQSRFDVRPLPRYFEDGWMWRQSVAWPDTPPVSIKSFNRRARSIMKKMKSLA